MTGVDRVKALLWNLPSSEKSPSSFKNTLSGLRGFCLLMVSMVMCAHHIGLSPFLHRPGFDSSPWFCVALPLPAFPFILYCHYLIKSNKKCPKYIKKGRWKNIGCLRWFWREPATIPEKPETKRVSSSISFMDPLSTAARLAPRWGRLLGLIYLLSSWLAGSFALASKTGKAEFREVACFLSCRPD